MVVENVLQDTTSFSVVEFVFRKAAEVFNFTIDRLGHLQPSTSIVT